MTGVVLFRLAHMLGMCSTQRPFRDCCLFSMGVFQCLTLNVFIAFSYFCPFRQFTVYSNGQLPRSSTHQISNQSSLSHSIWTFRLSWYDDGWNIWMIVYSKLSIHSTPFISPWTIHRASGWLFILFLFGILCDLYWAKPTVELSNDWRVVQKGADAQADADICCSFFFFQVVTSYWLLYMYVIIVNVVIVVIIWMWFKGD